MPPFGGGCGAGSRRGGSPGRGLHHRRSCPIWVGASPGQPSLEADPQCDRESEDRQSRRPPCSICPRRMGHPPDDLCTPADRVRNLASRCGPLNRAERHFGVTLRANGEGRRRKSGEPPKLIIRRALGTPFLPGGGAVPSGRDLAVPRGWLESAAGRHWTSGGQSGPGEISTSTTANLTGNRALAHRLLKEGDAEGAVREFKKLARSGDSLGALVIGLIRAEQGRMDAGDPDGAEAWLRWSADRGSAEAMNRLGTLRSDQRKWDGPDGAEHWYRAAIDAGHAQALYNLSLLRRDQGKLRRPRSDCAVYWLGKAAEAGVEGARSHLDSLGASWWSRLRRQAARHQAL